MTERLRRAWHLIREFVAIAFWIFVPIKLFVYDVDLYLARVIHPWLVDLLNYKFIFIAGLLIIWRLAAGNKRFAADMAFVGFYPFIIVFWYLPKKVFRSWLRVFILFFGIIASFRAIRFRLIANFIAVASTIIILAHLGTVPTYVAMVALILYLATQYARQFRAAFSPTTFLRRVTNLLTRQWVELRETMINNNLNELGKQQAGSEAYATTRLNQLQFLYMINKLTVIVASKLRIIQQSRLVLAYFVMTLSLLLGMTVITFGLEYYALSGLDSRAFMPGTHSSVWYFLYFSLSTMLNANVDLTPIAVPAVLLVSMQRLCAVVVLVIFVSIVVMVLRERYDEDIKALIEGLIQEGRWIEEASEKRYGLAFRDAESEIRRLAPGLVTFITFIEGSSPNNPSA